jgi:uncharacterized protein (TIGR04255 family)
MAPQYKRPPITEAVIEVRLANILDVKTIEKLKDKFADTHPLPPIPLLDYKVDISDSGAMVSKNVNGYRITSADGLEIVTIASNHLATSKLAPYEGWESFFDGAMKNWNVWKRVVGWKPINRIGIRFLNRIDIPTMPDIPIETADYFNFSIDMPNFKAGKMHAYLVQASIALNQEYFRVTLNSGNVPPALIGHQSFVMDIDLYREQELPQNDEGLWDCINSARKLKNEVFETCITDKTREIFST